MKRTRVLGLFAAATASVTFGVTALVAAPAASADPLDEIGALIIPVLAGQKNGPLTVATKDVNVKVRDGVTLLTTTQTPAGAAPAGGWPLVVFPGTFAGDGVNANLMAKLLASYGFQTASYIPRGLGKSTGEIDAAGPKDVSDVSDVITWMLANSTSDKDKIGVASVSYGAGFLPMVIANDPRVKAGAMVSGWGDMYQSRFPNDTNAVVSTAALQTIGQVQGRLSAEGKKFFGDAIAGRPVTAAQRAYADVRSPQHYLPQLQKRNAPLYMSTSMNEMVWPADQTIKFFTDYPGVKHLDVMPGDHATTELLMGDGLAGYTWQAAFQWLQTYVAGGTTPIQAAMPVRVAPRTGLNLYGTNYMTKYQTESYATAAGSATGKRYHLASKPGVFGLGGTMALSPTAGTGSTKLRYGQNMLMTNGLPMYEGAAEVLTGSPTTVNLALVDPGVTAVWTSDALAAATQIRGPIKAHLDVKPSAATGSVFVYALDVGPSGPAKLIGHKPYSWSGAKAGQSLGIDVAVPYQGFDVPKGHKLAFAVSTDDVMYTSQNKSGSTVTVGPGSYVDFPIK